MNVPQNEIMGDGFDDDEAVGVFVYAEPGRVVISGNHHGQPFQLSNNVEDAYRMAMRLIECCYTADGIE